MKRVIILGAGASVREGVNSGLWDQIKNEEIWSLNSCFKAMPYLPKIQMWVDLDFFNHEVNNLQKLYEQGVKLVCKKHHKFTGILDYTEQHLTTREIDKYYGKRAIENNIIYYTAMGLCGAFALSYAIANSYTDIFLLGFDFGSPNLEQKLTHWYQDRITELNIMSTGAGRPEVYLHKQEGFRDKVKSEIEGFEVYTREKDINIINVSPISHINYFPKINYEQFLNKIS